MKFAKISVLVLVNLFSLHLFAEDAVCEKFLTSKKAALIVKGISEIDSNKSDLWPTFDLSATPIFLIDEKNYKNCVLKIEGSKVESTELKTQVPIDNHLYTFCGTSIKQSCPNDDSSNVAVVYRLDNVIDGLEAFGFEPFKIDFATIAHESFHLIGQSQAALKFGWWSKFTNGSLSSSESRNEIVQKCYNQNAEVLKMIQKETELLQNLTKAALDKTLDLENLRTKASEYISARQSRQDFLSGLSILIAGKNSCGEAESYMEFLEGTAEFIGLQTAIDGKVMSNSDLLGWIKNALDYSKPAGEYFYRTGAMMLLIMKNSDLNGFNKSVSIITGAANSDETVFFAFKKWAQEK